ncbi:MAG: transglycosylase domain-containing protein [Lachnospiraceae bacterium]|nr:transglycosylase domain-containing protein [Lachnospiraceae bacterium]
MVIIMNYGKKGVRKKQHALNSKSIKVKKMFTVSVLKVMLVVLLSFGVIGICAGIGVFRGIISSAPEMANIDVSPTGFSTFVYDCEGHETAKLVSSDSNRIPVSMDKIPENLAHAFVAIEDERFYEHNGIDIQGIMRAAVIGIKNKDFSQGASTITQQLLKNNVFKGWVDENSFIEKVKRKIQEQYLALELEKVMDKDKILENYMNSINLGQSTLGVQAASLRYFNKPVYELNLSECAVIASITQNPSKYNPITHPDKNAERRKKTLNNMLEFGYITQDEYDEAINDTVYDRIQTVNIETDTDSVYTYFVDELTEQVLQDLIDIKGYNETQAYTALYSGGLSIYTTQDPKIQTICDTVYNDESNYPENTKWYLTYALTIEHSNGETENFSSEMYKAYYQQQNTKFNMLYASQDEAKAAVEAYKAAVMNEGDEVLSENISMTPQPQVSLTIEDQSTGHIVAMVGGRGTKEGSRTLNRASNTTRQPGSTFKIVSTYAPALDSAGLTLATVFTDAPFNYENGRPVSNWYSGGYKGICSLRYGIEQSLNIIAVKTLTAIKPKLGFDYLENFGFSTLVASRTESDGRVVSDIGQPLALGGITDGVTNMELNASYASIANHGTYIKPTLYTKIVDHEGNVLIDNTQPESHQVIKETTAFLLTDAMVDVVTKGTGGSVNFGGMAMAGKTGTTTDYKDVWFSGYTPYYTATTWAGYDNNVSLSGSAEKALAKTMWKNVMSQIHSGLENKPFTVPSGIVQATVCAKSGKLPIAGLCDADLKTEYFADGTVPTETCDVHYQGMVCMYSGLPASDKCPFKVSQALELTPSGDAALSGNTTTTPNSEEGSTQMCPHDDAFFANPSAEAVIQQETLELQQRAAQNAANAAPTVGPVTPEVPIVPTPAQ